MGGTPLDVGGTPVISRSKFRKKAVPISNKFMCTTMHAWLAKMCITWQDSSAQIFQKSFWWLLMLKCTHTSQDQELEMLSLYN